MLALLTCFPFPIVFTLVETKISYESGEQQDNDSLADPKLECPQECKINHCLNSAETKLMKDKNNIAQNSALASEFDDLKIDDIPKVQMLNVVQYNCNNGRDNAMLEENTSQYEISKSDDAEQLIDIIKKVDRTSSPQQDKRKINKVSEQKSDTKKEAIATTPTLNRELKINHKYGMLTEAPKENKAKYPFTQEDKQIAHGLENYDEQQLKSIMDVFKDGKYHPVDIFKKNCMQKEEAHDPSNAAYNLPLQIEQIENKYCTPSQIPDYTQSIAEFKPAMQESVISITQVSPCQNFIDVVPNPSCINENIKKLAEIAKAESKYQNAPLYHFAQSADKDAVFQPFSNSKSVKDKNNSVNETKKDKLYYPNHSQNDTQNKVEECYDRPRLMSKDFTQKKANSGKNSNAKAKTNSIKNSPNNMPAQSEPSYSALRHNRRDDYANNEFSKTSSENNRVLDQTNSKKKEPNYEVEQNILSIEPLHAITEDIEEGEGILVIR